MRAAWSGMELRYLGVMALYPPGGEGTDSVTAPAAGSSSTSMCCSEAARSGSGSQVRMFPPAALASSQW